MGESSKDLPIDGKSSSTENEKSNQEEKESDQNPEVTPNSFETSSTSPTLNNEWLSELDNKTISLTVLSKIQYVIFCSEVQSFLNTLLAEDKTETSAMVSKLFKSFRSSYLSGVKLKHKVFELETLRRLAVEENKSVSAQIGSREEKIKFLEGHLMEVEVKRAQVEASLKDLERLAEELNVENTRLKSERRKFQLQEENPQNNADSDTKASKTTSPKTKPNHSDDHRGSFEERIRHEESINSDLRRQIHELQQEIKPETQMKIQAQVLIAKRDKELQKKQNVIESLNSFVQKLKLDIETSNAQERSLKLELKQFQKKLNDSEAEIYSLKNIVSGQKFQMLSLRTKKGTLEKQLGQKQEKSTSLQVELDRVTKLQSNLEAKVYAQEQKIAELKVFYEQRLQELHMQNKELQELMKQGAEKDLIIEKCKKEIQNLEDELKNIGQELKDRIADLTTEVENNVKTRQTVESLRRKIAELKIKLKSEEAKKEELDFQLIHLTNTVSELRNQMDALDTKHQQDRAELSKLKKKLEEEKYIIGDLRDSERVARRKLEGTRTKLKETKQLHQAFSEGTKKQIERIKLLDEEVNSLRHQVKSLTTDNNTLSYSLQQLQTKSHDLSRDVQAKEKECLKVMETLGDRDHELKSVKNSFQRLMEKKIAVDCKVAEKDMEIERMGEEYKLLEKDRTGCKKGLRVKEEEVKILEAEIRLLSHSKSVMQKQLADAEHLKRDINTVRSHLQKERLKTKTLEHALRKPTNIHRWRILEGQDPDATHLLRKNILFQRELMRKSDSLFEMESHLREKDALLRETRGDLERRKGKEEEILTRKRRAEEEKDGMRRQLEEKAVCEGMVEKFKSEMERMRREMREMKLKEKGYVTI